MLLFGVKVIVNRTHVLLTLSFHERHLICITKEDVTDQPKIWRRSALELANEVGYLNSLLENVAQKN